MDIVDKLLTPAHHMEGHYVSSFAHQAVEEILRLRSDLIKETAERQTLEEDNIQLRKLVEEIKQAE